MALCEIRWFSRVLDKRVTTLVILPDVGRPPFPVLYLLHGLTDDYTAWTRQTRIEPFVAEYPLIVVMPDGFRGFYTANHVGRDYATYTAVELPEMIERTFPAKASRAARSVGGVSMGGYGALRVALGFGERYVSCHSHGGALMNGSRDQPPDRFADAKEIFGPHPRGTEHDLLLLAKRAKAAQRLPAIRLFCGTEDHLLEDNREFHRRLTTTGVPHLYIETPGGHNWDCWNEQIRDALSFHAGLLRIKKIQP